MAPAPSEFISNPDYDGLATHIESYGVQCILHQYSNSLEEVNLDFTNDDMVIPDNPTYICHWKDLLISSCIIKPSSLSFQEDDAFIYTVLCYPNPVKDWSLWGTISLYALKLMCSISATALNLYRSVTFNRITTKSEELPDIKEFAGNMNHAGPSVTNAQSMLPNLKHENKTFHTSELLFHIKVLERSNESLSLTFPSGVIRFPVTAGIDEQEINQGTYINNGVLCGLEKQMNALDIIRVGLKNLGTYIAEENNFITAVREYRLMDFAGIFCSNSFTSFESHALDYNECTRDLNEMLVFADSCEQCLKANLSCKYNQIDQQCGNCVKNDTKCVSLIVLHVLWDMGSSHKKTAKQSSSGLELDSTDSEMMDPRRYTIGFGGLHLSKSFVNTTRNHVLQFNGEYFGVDMLIALRDECDLLQLIKNAVFVGKDRQSDLLAYLTVGPSVKETLKIKKEYSIQRIPEKYLSFKPNASTQKKVVYAVDVCSNRNGDIFILDAGAACIHVVDRCTVAAVFIIGRYMKPNLHTYPSKIKNVTRKLRLSNSTCDMSMDANDNLFVSDSGRGEIIYVPKCLRAKKSKNTLFHIMKVKGILSSACSTDGVYVLRQKESGKLVQFMSFDVPKKHTKKLCIGFKVLLKVRVVCGIERLFSVPFVRCFGTMGADKLLKIYYHTAKSKHRATEITLSLSTCSKPHVSHNGTLLTSTDTSIVVHKLKCAGKTASTEFVRTHHVTGMVVAFCLSGKVISAAIMNQNNFHLHQYGPLNFALQYTNAVSKLYDAIGYIPPGGSRASRLQRRNIPLNECVLKAEQCSNLMQEMQTEAKERTPGRSSFHGPDGMPFTDTIRCLQSTIESWNILIDRVERLDKGSSQRIYSPSVTSEKYVEHSFGFVKKKGQGQNQTMEEYIVSKRRHVIHFQMRMCKLPFCQYTKDSLQDKGYQQIEGDRCVLTKQELQELFAIKEKEDCIEDITEIPADEDNMVMKAYLVSKSVPRQSNRAKWRESSGYQPNMLLEKSSFGKLYKDDLVCFRSVTNTLIYFIFLFLYRCIFGRNNCQITNI